MTALGFNNPGKRINDGLVSSEDEEVSLFEVNQRNKEENNDAELLSSKSNGTVNVRESTRERTSKQSKRSRKKYPCLIKTCPKYGVPMSKIGRHVRDVHHLSSKKYKEVYGRLWGDLVPQTNAEKATKRLTILFNRYKCAEDEKRDTTLTNGDKEEIELRDMTRKDGNAFQKVSSAKSSAEPKRSRRNVARIVNYNQFFLDDIDDLTELVCSESRKRSNNVTKHNRNQQAKDGEPRKKRLRHGESDHAQRAKIIEDHANGRSKESKERTSNDKSDYFPTGWNCNGRGVRSSIHGAHKQDVSNKPPANKYNGFKFTIRELPNSTDIDFGIIRQEFAQEMQSYAYDLVKEEVQNSWSSISINHEVMVYCMMTASVMAWDGMAWHAMGWHGMALAGIGWHAMGWHWLAWNGMAWDGMGWHEMAWHGMAWGGMGWHGMGWHGMA
ncbi:predicted protein [Nematostella vectensis]|uniref:Uncharacterized protein n=1 Tax=Nematostella vectensis TaxID=45351 RepID=A7S1N4_NEMVE|nr:predicted protein [Nematostella vectensis]|eukprot:XP_001634456.1 predicted protein [Nematostella vectensis]